MSFLCLGFARTPNVMPVWWVYLTRPHHTVLLLLFLHRTEGEKARWKRSWAEIKTGTSLINYHHGQNRLGQTWLGED